MLTGKLEEIKIRYEELTNLMGSPDVVTNQKLYQKYATEHSSLKETVETFEEILHNQEAITDTKEMLSGKDEEMKALAKEELPILEEEKVSLEEKIKILLLPKDPNDNKSIIMEIRAGAGGDESTLFASELFRMYTKYAETHKWKLDILSSNPTGLNGYKEIIFMLDGDGVYSKLKYESGVHRVQRVPETESSGRRHTSTVTVAVMPEAEEVELEINPDDLRTDTFRAGGNGGQNVNKVESAVRITHLPTNTVVSCQDEKSQHKNRAKAMKILRSRILDAMIQEQDAEIAKERKGHVGTGDRSEKIRTYNFPQNRVTDHRFSLTLHKLDTIMEGDIDELIDTVRSNFQAEVLKAGS